MVAVKPFALVKNLASTNRHYPGNLKIFHLAMWSTFHTTSVTCATASVRPEI
ncbi:hypothetical protein GMO_09010 [Gluconobacter morbifer G707]|uniref:Uncharacterized protein n=1 Tax=Gluconobacter morbifer G707 TaxID=1088869 RepID=G6XHD5_9PROT|nr:hypothetical protein GMO_09010 [Gluconobacter morbifer G707]